MTIRLHGLLCATLLGLGVAGCKKPDCRGARRSFERAMMEYSFEDLADPEVRALVLADLDSKPAATAEELAKMFELAKLGTRPGAALPQSLLDRKAAFEKACK